MIKTLEFIIWILVYVVFFLKITISNMFQIKKKMVYQSDLNVSYILNFHYKYLYLILPTQIHY